MVNKFLMPRYKKYVYPLVVFVYANHLIPPSSDPNVVPGNIEEQLVHNLFLSVSPLHFYCKEKFGILLSF